MDNSLTVKLVGSVVRAALTAGGAVLVSKGMASQDQVAAIVGPGSEIVVGAVLVGTSLLWSWAQKLISHRS